MTTSTSASRFFSPACILILVAGLALRLFLAANTVIVNPDGILYIHQARAIYYGQWQNLTSCGLSFISGYPFLIAGMHFLISDWIWSARLVSILLGWLTLIPLYGILRQFLTETGGLLCLLMFALMPALVSNSAEVVREPMMWCFGVTGLYLIILYLKSGQNRLPVVACICFLLASWARMEGILLILSTIAYFLIWHKPDRIRAIFWFVLPGLFAGLMVWGCIWTLDLSVQQTIRGNEMAKKGISVLRSYENLRTELKQVIQQDTATPVLSRLLAELRNSIWLVALATLINRILEAFFYPFLIFFLVGLKDVRKRLKNTPGLIYLVFFCVMDLILLYFHTIETWMIYYRFLGLVMFASAVLAGFGLDRIQKLLIELFSLTPKRALIFTILAILVAGLPKNLIAPDSDKRVFVDIGNAIAERHHPDTAVAVATSQYTQQWIAFYANPDASVGLCPKDKDAQWEQFPNHPLYFYIFSRQKQIRYVLWEERNWPDHFFSVDHLVNSRFFQIIGTWHHPDTGNMILFEVK